MGHHDITVRYITDVLSTFNFVIFFAVSLYLWCILIYINTTLTGFITKQTTHVFLKGCYEISQLLHHIAGLFSFEKNREELIFTEGTAELPNVYF